MTQVQAALRLLGGGLVVAVLRLAWASDWLRGPGAAALTDLLGCLLAGGALFGVLAMRSLAAGAARDVVLEQGLAALAVCAWLVASLPPRASNYAPPGVDDFVTAYAPASLAAVALVVALGAQWPVAGVRALLVRHALVLALVTPLAGGLVGAAGLGAEPLGELSRALLAGGAWAAVGLVLTLRR